MNARAPVDLPTRLIDVLDLLAQHLIGAVMLAHGSLSPGIIAAERHPQRLREHADGRLLPNTLPPPGTSQLAVREDADCFLEYRVPAAFFPVRVSDGDFLPPKP